MKILRLLFIFAAWCSFSPAIAKPAATLNVATREVPPFVMKNGGKLTGFSIDLWNAITTELKVDSRFTVKNSVKELLQAVRGRQADLAIAAISVTAERDQQVDFSQPIYDSGLQVLVRGNATAPSLLVGLGQLFGSPIMKQFIIAVALLILIPAHALWLIERRSDDGIIRHKKYFPGIFEAAWWTVSCLATQAEEMPKTVMARVLAVIWMFFAIIFIAFVTAALTANLTVQSLHGDIHGPDDLPGKAVATVNDSTSAQYLAKHNVTARTFPAIADAFAALDKGEVEAVVYDAPVLLYYAANEGKGRSSVVGPIFRKECYAIAFPNGSPWRKPVNFALLKIKESGAYDALHDKWFKGADQN